MLMTYRPRTSHFPLTTPHSSSAAVITPSIIFFYSCANSSCCNASRSSFVLHSNSTFFSFTIKKSYQILVVLFSLWLSALHLSLRSFACIPFGLRSDPLKAPPITHFLSTCQSQLTLHLYHISLYRYIIHPTRRLIICHQAHAFKVKCR